MADDIPRAPEVRLAKACFHTTSGGMMTFKRRALAVAACAVAPLLLNVPSPALAQTKPTVASPATSGKKAEHRLILQVNTNEPAVMNLVLNNAANTEKHYKAIGEQVQIEIVTFGPGLNMLREDSSPVKDRIKSLAQTTRSISFAACDNTRASMSRTEQKEIPLISQAKIVPSGVVRVMELQELGWSYIRP